MERRVFLITGASRGIGLAILQSLAQREPNNIYVLGVRSLASGQETVKDLEGKGIKGTFDIAVIDITNDESIRVACEDIRMKFEKLDCLINNAGSAANPQEADHSDFRAIYNRVFDTNITSPALMTTLFMPLLSKSPDPRVIMIGSARGSVSRQTTAKLPPTASIPYSVSKTALNIVTLELAKLNPEVLYQVASPGHCKTALNGYRGTKDPLDGAKVVVELACSEREAYAEGFWEHEEGQMRKVPW